MNSIIPISFRYSLVLIISLLFVSGCSGSSDSNSDESQTTGEVSGTDGGGLASGAGTEGTDGVANEMQDATTGDSTSGSTGGTQTELEDGTEESTSGSTTGSTTEPESDSGPEDPTTTRVDFDITVPVYSSATLQVRLVWGDINTTAMWNIDQHWTASADLPVNTSNELVVTFSDSNGAITLGSAERSFTTGANPSESVQITADEFDTDRWDSDGDGESNLSEAIAGTNSQGTDALEPIQASLELVPDKTFRISWEQSDVAQSYRVFENPDGISGFTDISGELEASTTVFDHRVALYARVNAQYLVQSCNDQGCVDSEPVMVTGTLDGAIGTVAEHYVGGFVSLSADGSTLAVGSPNESSNAKGIDGNQVNTSGTHSGAVFVFVRDGDDWQQQAYIKASISYSYTHFGGAVSLSADGNTLAVGGGKHGVVFMFVRDDETWQELSYFDAANTDQYDSFGISVSLSADGNTLAVGATTQRSAATGINGDQTDQSTPAAGAVYVFVRNGETWQEQAYIKASNTDEGDRFGASVSLSADGNTLAVGAPTESSAATGINGDQSDNSVGGSGAVYMFVRNGETWQQQAYIKASNPDQGDGFGFKVSVSADGSTLAVTAGGEDSSSTGINGDQNDNSVLSSGAVYVFARNGEVWQQQAYVKASNTVLLERFGDSFGGAVSLSADGNTLAVGATEEDSAATGINGDQNDNSASSSGAAYVFVRNGETWQQQAYVKASNSSPYYRFGSDVSLSADSHTLAVVGTTVYLY